MELLYLLFFLVFVAYLLRDVYSVSPKGAPTRIQGVSTRETEHILYNSFEYYKRLEPEEKKRFLVRTLEFMKHKSFSTRQDLVLTKEMKVLVSASAIQLSFGLDEYLFESFHQIILYPKAYFNQQTEKWHKGEVSLSGAIVLSWTSFQKGYSDPTDNYNLGLHEMAHALRFDKFRGEDYDKFFAQYFDKWYVTAREEFQKLKRHEPSFFREYGGTNINEFFSVCVEYFFESPAAFKERLPEIYKQMCILLNQDPLQKFQSEKPVRDELLGKNHAPEPTEPLIFRSARPGFVSPSVTFILFPIILLGPFAKAVEEGNAVLLLSVGLIAAIAILFHLNKTLKRFYIYQNMLIAKYPIFMGPHVFPLDHLVRVSLHEENNSMYHNSMELNYLDNGRIETKIYSMYLGENDLKKLADLLTERKIPVMIKGFREVFST